MYSKNWFPLLFYSFSNFFEAKLLATCMFESKWVTALVSIDMKYGEMRKN